MSSPHPESVPVIVGQRPTLTHAPTISERSSSSALRYSTLSLDELRDLVKRNNEQIIDLAHQLRVYHELDDYIDQSPPSADHPYGYVVAFCAFTAQFIILGSLNTFSLFNNAMKSDSQWGEPGYTKIALVSSLANFISTIVGTFAGHASDVYGPRPLFVGAALLLLLGEYFGSHATTYLEFALIYPLMVGTAAGCIISPGLGSVAGWFDKRRGLALGIAYAGSGAGSAIVPLAASSVFSWYEGDWRSTMRWMSALSLPCALTGLFICHRLRVKRFQTARRSVSELIYSRPFVTLWAVGAFFGYGFFTAVYNVIPYAMAQGKGTYKDEDPISVEHATLLMSVFGVMQCLGNVVFGYFADMFGNTVLFALSHISSGVLLILMAYAHTLWELLLVVGAIGFTTAGCITCYPHVAAQYYHGPQLTSALALLYTGFGVGSLVGPPLTEVVISSQGGNFTMGLWIAGGAFLMAAFGPRLFLPSVEEYRSMALVSKEDGDFVEVTSPHA